MNEKLLQYIWRYQLYDNSSLTCVLGNQLVILHAGVLNTDQGPDFSEARIMYGDALWVGNVELHVHASDWYVHKHEADKNYQNIILHVVWDYDDDRLQSFPTLSLKGLIPDDLLNAYSMMMNNDEFLPCRKQLADIREISMEKWKERLLAERLISKSELVLNELNYSGNDWNETSWRLTAKYFGGTVNAEAFYQVARSLPWKVLQKHRNDRFRIEALLFGQSGLLNNDIKDEYGILLSKEYSYLSKLWSLYPIKNSMHFMRMRPSGFPTIRLSQLSGLIHANEFLFSSFLNNINGGVLRDKVSIAASLYWNNHYCFDVPAASKQKRPGTDFTDGMIVNVLIPLVFAFGIYHSDEKLKALALDLLEKLPAENNHMVRGFRKLGWTVKNAFDAQSIIQLKKKYCDVQACLSCAIGKEILSLKPGSKINSSS